MASLYLLIPIAIVLVCIAAAIFMWAVKSDQFEDLERHGHNVLFDDEDTNKSDDAINPDETIMEHTCTKDADTNTEPPFTDITSKYPPTR